MYSTSESGTEIAQGQTNLNNRRIEAQVHVTQNEPNGRENEENLNSAEAEVSPKFTQRQFLILLVYSFTEFSFGTLISLQAPFYPVEAEKKGLIASEYGLIFGIFEFTTFVVSLVYGKYLFKVGPKVAYNSGLLVQGICSILFGTLDRIDGRTTFFVMSMVIRIIEAMAGAACVNAAFTIIALEFPKSVATTFGTMEVFFTFGATSGPVIGGALYQLGGYSLPFYFSGTLLVLTSILTLVVFPTPVDSNAELKSSRGLGDLLRIPEVAVAIFVIFASALSMGHLASTLEPHIRQFNLSTVSIGLVMVILGAAHAVTSPLWGRFCDKKPMLNLYMLLGCVFTIVGFLFIGPAPFVPFETILWVTCGGLVLHGIGLAGCLVASLIQCLKSASTHGFPDNLATYSLLSGSWASFFSLGHFIGPTLSGILYDTVGFRNGTLFVIGLESVVILVLASMMYFQKKTESFRRGRLDEVNESDPLLGTHVVTL